MLTENTYVKGMTINEQLKYNSKYNKAQLFAVICEGLASKLLDSEFATELTNEQYETLNKLANR